MALPTSYRWISVGKLTVRNQKNAPARAPRYELADLMAALRGVVDSPRGRREYQKQDRRMWCSPVADHDPNFYTVLVQTGDKSIADAAYVDFETGASRAGGKRATEGGHFCSHIIIKKQPDRLGRHLLLLEKVPGTHLASIKAHFNWILANVAPRRAVVVDGENKPYLGTTEVDGFQSRTLAQAMTSGTVMDIQLVGNEVREDGLDDNDLIRETVHQVRLDVRRRVDEQGAARLLRLGIDRLRGWEAVEQEDRELLVRIKSDGGQVKTATVVVSSEEIEDATQEALGSAFYLNEIVTDFERPLTQRYEFIRDDMIEKMKARARALNP